MVGRIMKKLTNNKYLWLQNILGASVELSCEPDVRQIIISKDSEFPQTNDSTSGRSPSAEKSHPLDESRGSTIVITKVENAQKKPKLSKAISSFTGSTNCKNSKSCTDFSVASCPTDSSIVHSKRANSSEHPDKLPYGTIKLEHNMKKKVFVGNTLNTPYAKKTTDEFESSEESFLFDPALDYTLNKDGSVTCKICKETVPSRTHWYRHKYKVTKN